MIDESLITTLQSIYNISQKSVLVISDDQVVFANDAFLDYTGEKDSNIFPAESTIILDYVTAQDRDELSRCLSVSCAGQRVSVRLLGGKGEYHPFDVEFVPMELNGHAIRAMIFTKEEGSEFSTQGLLQGNSLFKQVFKLSPDPIVITRMGTGEFVEGNSAFWNLVGVGQEGVTSMFDLWADDTVGQLMHQELVTKSSIYNMPATVKTRGGVYRELRFFAEKISIDNEDLVLTIGRDVTDELDRERELQRNKEFAEVASRSKSEFLANMSHELRTPLNAIIGFSEILHDQIFGPIEIEKYLDYAKDINQSGKYLLDIVNDILDLSKVEAGRLETDMANIDPFDGIEQCLRLVAAKAANGDIRIETAFDRSIRLRTDERLLKQIVLNLLSNAVKFTPDGGMIVCSMQHGVDGFVTLGVADTGIGMTAEEMQQALEPFGQVNATTTRKMEGTGLGLPLVKAIAEKLGGRFLLDSARGEGTQVRIIWPRAFVVDAADMEDEEDDLDVL